MDSQYTDQVTITVLVPKTEIPSLKSDITEATNGRAVLNEKEDLYYALLDGEILTGDALRAQKQ